MNLFDDFLVPLALQMFAATVVISTFAIAFSKKIIPDENKRKKIITNYLFLTIGIFLGLLAMILSYA